MQKSGGVVEKEIVFSGQQDTISDTVSGLVLKESLEVVDIEVIEEETTVYNFEVEDDHTYFVTVAEVWVHNDDRAEYSGNTNREALLSKFLKEKGEEELRKDYERASKAITAINKKVWILTSEDSKREMVLNAALEAEN